MSITSTLFCVGLASFCTATGQNETTIHEITQQHVSEDQQRPKNSLKEVVSPQDTDQPKKIFGQKNGSTILNVVKYRIAPTFVYAACASGVCYAVSKLAPKETSFRTAGILGVAIFSVFGIFGEL